MGEWLAVIDSGGTLHDLYLWDTLYYPRYFMAKVLAFAKMKSLIDLHTEDAKAKAIEAKSKAK
jgi:hypothetical protein